MIPEGKYKARATECVFNQDDKGRGQAIIRFEIIDGDHAGDTITKYCYFVGGATEFSIKDLDTIGCRMEGGDPTDTEGMGVDVQIVIEHEMWEGKNRAKVRYVNKLGGPLVEGMDANAKRSFADSLRGQVLAFKQANPSAPRAAAVAPAPTRTAAARPTAQRAPTAASRPSAVASSVSDHDAWDGTGADPNDFGF